VPMPNRLAARQNSPGKYERIITKSDQGGPGISFLIGFKKGGGSEIQSVHFDKKKFTAAQAKAWLKKHKFKTAVEAASEAVMPDYSFEEIRKMVCDALEAKFPMPQTNGMGYPCCAYYMDNLWPARALIRKSMMSEDESLPDIALISYTIKEDADGDGMAELGEPVECSIQAVPKDGSPGAVIDEGEHVDAPVAEAGKRNSATDAIHANSIVRHALSMMSPSDVEAATQAHMQAMASGMESQFPLTKEASVLTEQEFRLWPESKKIGLYCELVDCGEINL